MHQERVLAATTKNGDFATRQINTINTWIPFVQKHVAFAKVMFI